MEDFRLRKRPCQETSESWQAFFKTVAKKIAGFHAV